MFSCSEILNIFYPPVSYSLTLNVGFTVFVLSENRSNRFNWCEVCQPQNQSRGTGKFNIHWKACVYFINTRVYAFLCSLINWLTVITVRLFRNLTAGENNFGHLLIIKVILWKNMKTLRITRKNPTYISVD